MATGKNAASKAGKELKTQTTKAEKTVAASALGQTPKGSAKAGSKGSKKK
jgi:hypothetical protein